MRVKISIIFFEAASDTATHAVANVTIESINYFTNFEFDHGDETYSSDKDRTTSNRIYVIHIEWFAYGSTEVHLKR